MSEQEQARVEQKLRYAKLHLEELVTAPSGRGDDFERSHHEAVLAQLAGAYDAFLCELNAVLGCGRKASDVSLGKLRDSLVKQGRSSTVLRRLYQMQQDKACWLRQLQDLRHAATHRKAIPLAFRLGGPKDGKVAFRHPDTHEEMLAPASETLTDWLKNMSALFSELRGVAVSENAG